MPDAPPPPEWLDQANRLATIAWLLSSTVHDANNILQVISGNAEMIEAVAAGNETLLKRSTSIAANAAKASALLSELLEFSREAEVPSAAVDLRELAERSLGLRNYAMRKLRIAAAVTGDAGIRVKANPKDVLQIVVNLLVNAERVLTGRADARLSLSVSGDASTGTLAIEDNGPGLPESRRSNVFATSINSAVGAADGRLGLGLGVAERLAVRQGGALTYAPAAGSGCVFRLMLTRG